jgi:hypothetical protein
MGPVIVIRQDDRSSADISATHEEFSDDDLAKNYTQIEEQITVKSIIIWDMTPCSP